MRSINMKGEILLEFSNDMYVPTNIDVMNGQSNQQRRLQDSEQIKEFLELKITNSETSESLRNLGFTWNVTHFDKDSFTIQCYFEQSVYISCESGTDILEILF